ncbi:MAG: beta-N-acetylhexosaminidase, partial [Flavobacteriales bacterium]|nr:beta-N-acetylhexosaminidase [Flavobacteriales bacterium]
MKHMRLIPFFIGFAAQVSAQQSELPTVIPAPVEIRLNDGEFKGAKCNMTCPWSTKISDSISPVLASSLRSELEAFAPAEPFECIASFSISLVVTDVRSADQPEAYQLDATPFGITVTSATEAGLFRGSRTLIQLLEQGRETGSLPCLSITDHPRFPWRGMHLDV